MKIQYVSPFDLSHIAVNLDLELDFVKFDVAIVGWEESNKFLVSMWHQMNMEILPEHCKEKCPWAYFPNRYIGKKSHVLTLGCVQTSIGELFVALSFTTKGNIDSIHFHNKTGEISVDDHRKLKMLVDRAVKEKDNVSAYTCEAQIFSKSTKVSICSYSAENFEICPLEKGIFMIRIRIYAIDALEAKQIAVQHLYDFTAFLSVETNIFYSFKDVNILLHNSFEGAKGEPQYVNDYIDDYPIKGDNILYLSEFAVDFIDKHIFSLPRFGKREEADRLFLSACKHCQIGMELEDRLMSEVVAITPYRRMSVSKKDQLRKGEFITSSMMEYMSALECSTAIEAIREICPTCGTIKYKISQRVKDLVTRFLGEDLGKVFKKLYGLRSKYLHEGRVASEANVVETIPVLSENSDVMLINVSGFTLRFEGQVCQFSIRNVREWTTYVLRCFYQMRILGRESFKDVFDQPADEPITIIIPNKDIFLETENT